MSDEKVETKNEKVYVEEEAVEWRGGRVTRDRERGEKWRE